MLSPAATGSGASHLVMERSAVFWTLCVAVALLLDGLGSAVAAVTVAVLVIVVPSFAVTCTMRRKIADPTGNVAAVAATGPVPPTFGSVGANAGPDVWLNETNLVPLGIMSARLTAAAVSGPALVTTMG